MDLDGTLIMQDSVFLQIKHLAASKLWLLPLFIFHFLKGGRPPAKLWLARAFPIHPETLHYRADLLDYLRAEKAQGRKLYLVSAATLHTVQRVAEYLNLFDAAYGSDASYNLKSKNKAAFIQKHIGADYAYAGDAWADVPVWKHARGMILCGKAARLKNIIVPAVLQLRRGLGQDAPDVICFPDPCS